MTLALISAALRRRPFTLLYAALLLAAFASLIGAPVPLALVAWFAASIAALELWHAAEPTILWRLGCCAPTHAERERIEASLGCVHLEVLVLDSPRLWLGRGLRCLVIPDDPHLGQARQVPVLLHEHSWFGYGFPAHLATVLATHLFV